MIKSNSNQHFFMTKNLKIVKQQKNNTNKSLTITKETIKNTLNQLLFMKKF